MNDEQILQRGGTETDIEEYAKQKGADFTETDFLKDLLIRKIEEFKPRKDIFGLSKTNKAKILAYNRVIRLIKDL
jgi:hypothetical protein